MATIDASIPLGVHPYQAPDQLNQLAKVMQMQTMQQEGQMNRLKMDEYQRSVTDANEMRNALSAPGADPYNVLLQRGRVKEATEFAKGKADIGKTGAETDAKTIETAHKRVDLMGSTLGWVRQNPTVENAVQAVQYLAQNGVLPPEKLQEALAKFNADPSPQAIAAFADLGFRAALSAKEQLPKFETRNTGGTTDTLRLDPVTGKAAVASSVQNTQSPDNFASNARIAADNAASRSVQIRGQNMTDERQRDLNETTRQQGKLPAGYRMAADGQSLEAIPGGPAALGKALPTKLVSDLGEQAGIADATARFSNTFKPEFAGKTILGEASNVKGRVFGDDTGQTQWWQDYALHESTVRNKLFGASLTPGEQAQWQKLTVTPRMNADEVKKNLQRRTEIEQRGLDRMMSGAAAGGYNKEQIEAVTGRAVPPKSAGVTPPQPTSGVPADIDAILKKHGGKK